MPGFPGRLLRSFQVGSPGDPAPPVDPGDVTAPTLSSATGTQTGQTTASLGVTTNEANGTLYSFVSTSATPPSATDLKAGTGAVFANSQTITTTGAKTASATGLTASTVYYVHWLHRDAAGNDSTIATSSSFTTASSGVADNFGHGAGTNLFTQPSAFDNVGSWNTQSLTVVANQSGTYDLVYPTTTGTYRSLRQQRTLVTGTNYTWCIDAQMAGMRWLWITGGAPFSYGGAYYDLQNGVVGSTINGVTASMIDLGGGKWRCKYQRVAASDAIDWFVHTPVDANGSFTTTVSGTNGILLNNAYLGTT